MKRILIAGANPYNANKGVAALAYSTVSMIHDIMSVYDGKYEICIYNHEFRKTDDYIELPKSKIKFQNVYPSNIWGVKNLFSTVFSRWRLYNLKEFIKSDIILNVTAGDSFSDIYGVNIFNSQNLVNRLARLFHKKIIFLPQTYGPFEKNSLVQKDALKSLRNANLIMSRDKKSTLYLIEHKIKDVVDTIDLAFYLPFERRDREDDNRINVGLNVSSLLWEKSPLNNDFFIDSIYSVSVHKMIRYLLEKGCIVHLIPHVLDSHGGEDEYLLAYRLWKEYNNKELRLSPFFYSPVEAKGYISSMDLFIGSRMHACIAAFSSNTPVLLLGYSRKFSGLFRETLGYKYCVDFTTMVDMSNLIYMIDEMLKKREIIHEQIEDINKTIVVNQMQQIKTYLKAALFE